ncbi:hypothetical protein PR048_005871 [Dryococelus australis]|uniref:Uncharacterized protein n=1 Tax=Dryococelus australis TaxID=614101 RepID=A0ABQ9I9D5_9NEOP|nr:hypothetical protein PR048_005871 [Dryococelus australis]
METDLRKTYCTSLTLCGIEKKDLPNARQGRGATPCSTWSKALGALKKRRRPAVSQRRMCIPFLCEGRPYSTHTTSSTISNCTPEAVIPAQITGDEFIPTFKAEGPVYQLVGSLLPELEQEAQFLQIYFVGKYKIEANLRCANHPEENVTQRQSLHKGFTEFLPPVKLLKLSSMLKKLPEGLRDRFNISTTNEVALVMVFNNLNNAIVY